MQDRTRLVSGLSRLLSPKSIAVIGGGAWCASIIDAAHRIGFRGEIFPVHPSGKRIAGLSALRRLEDRDGDIDAAFIGINRTATIEAVAALRELGAGGAVCFASGFTEAQAEDASAVNLQVRLVDAARDMPILGPNCYGYVNALDGTAIWPDQHGMHRVDRGVAILTQSSNIAINLTMQQRGLPLALIATVGNQAQLSQAEIARALLEDDRITAIGLHVEGFRDLRGWEALAQAAWERGLPLVAIKMGRSAQARQATVSHTASLAGSDAGAQALLDRLGIPRVDTLPAFLETLKLFHFAGRLPGGKIASISCSGGEASLVADMAQEREIEFPALTAQQQDDLRAALGPMVALANPLDYHTYVWRDVPAMTRVWSAMASGNADFTLSIVDYPVTDSSDWDCATQAALGARAATQGAVGVAATLPELMPQEIAATLSAGGVVPFHGLDEALAAIEAAASARPPATQPIALPGDAENPRLATEAEAKAILSRFGVPVPRGYEADSASGAADRARELDAPLVLKGLGVAHKSEAGAVVVNLPADAVAEAAVAMGAARFLVEEMVSDGVVELLVGATRDPAHGFVLTLAAGGVLTELLADRVSMLVPAPREALKLALFRLKTAPLLTGFRGRPAADLDAVLDAIEAFQAYVVTHADSLCEAEINPLICTPTRAVAADALIRKA